MGAYDSNPRKDAPPYGYGEPRPPPPPPPPQRPLPSEAAPVAGNLVDRFSGIRVRDPSSDNHLVQVIRAVEDAESTIKQQMENNQLKDELLRKTRELERYKLEAAALRSSTGLLSHDNSVESYQAYRSNTAVGNETDRIRTRWADNDPSVNPQGALVIHQNGIPETEEPSLQTSTTNQHYSETSKMNGMSNNVPGGHIAIESGRPSHISTPSSRSISPNRQRKEGDYDPRINLSGQGLVPVPDISSNILWKQDLIIKVREHEEEIAQLRKHLADYSVKEARILNEKSMLEKRIAYMRMAFDQQQQDLVDAASKALSYRQDIMEENIRLSYALQAAQQERSTFVSSLLPLLSEYGLQPSVLDAQSIVSNLKVLFKQLQEKLIITEEKFNESQYQITPWRAELSNTAGLPPPSPSHPLGKALVASSKNSLEIVPRPAFSHAQSPSANVQVRVDWEVTGSQNHHVGSNEFATRNLDSDNPGRISPSRHRIPNAQDASARPTQGESYVRFSVDSRNQNPPFTDLVRDSELAESDGVGVHHGREPSTPWGAASSPNMTSGLDEPSSYPYLPTVLEEPGSSFSEAAEDDPLPAIEGLRISGDAFPGRELKASGYSINRTTSCNFEWVRHLEDGSVNYIDGAKQPNYLVTADDVDSYLAIEVQPLDDRKRKGELVKVFANDQKKITCDLEMQEQIRKTLSVGHVSYEVLLSVKLIDIWEPAILAIKREGYSVKCNGARGVVLTEKFQQATIVTIPNGHPNALAIQSADGADYLLKTAENGLSRDTIVLTLKLFKMMALEKRKGRKRGLFFK